MKNSNEILAIVLIVLGCTASKPISKSTLKTDVITEPTVLVENKVSTNEAQSLTPDNDKWVAPEDAKKIENPIKTSDESIKVGMGIFTKNCRSCHGKLGDGKGVGAADCTTPPTSFLSEDFTNQSDGSVFWKINTGRNNMKSYKGTLDDDEIWSVINYIRSLKVAK